MQNQETQDSKRILGRQLGRELTNEELGLVAGGDGNDARIGESGTDTVPHGGTCTNEQDCD